MHALLIVDMQVAMLDRPIHALHSVIPRINDVARAMRQCGGLVIFIQHAGAPKNEFAPGQPGWHILTDLEKAPTDHVVSKEYCDSFCQTGLESLLERHQVSDVVVCGWASDYCVDTTIRAAASRSYNVVVVSDAHTVQNRSHLRADAIIEHHNLIWAAMDVPGQPMRVEPAERVVHGLCRGCDDPR